MKNSGLILSILALLNGFAIQALEVEAPTSGFSGEHEASEPKEPVEGERKEQELRKDIEERQQQIRDAQRQGASAETIAKMQDSLAAQQQQLVLAILAGTTADSGLEAEEPLKDFPSETEFESLVREIGSLQKLLVQHDAAYGKVSESDVTKAIGSLETINTQFSALTPDIERLRNDYAKGQRIVWELETVNTLVSKGVENPNFYDDVLRELAARNNTTVGEIQARLAKSGFKGTAQELVTFLRTHDTPDDPVLDSVVSDLANSERLGNLIDSYNAANGVLPFEFDLSPEEQNVVDAVLRKGLGVAFSVNTFGDESWLSTDEPLSREQASALVSRLNAEIAKSGTALSQDTVLLSQLLAEAQKYQKSLDETNQAQAKQDFVKATVGNDEIASANRALGKLDQQLAEQRATQRKLIESNKKAILQALEIVAKMEPSAARTGIIELLTTLFKSAFVDPIVNLFSRAEKLKAEGQLAQADAVAQEGMQLAQEAKRIFDSSGEGDAHDKMAIAGKGIAQSMSEYKATDPALAGQMRTLARGFK